MKMKKSNGQLFSELTFDVIQDKFGNVIVLTKLPLMISRISTVSGVKARIYGKAHTEKRR